MGGKFITIEGIEGSGKSSLIKGLEANLLLENKTVFLTKEPGGSKLGQKIREILLNSPDKISVSSEVLLFAADRAEHVSSTLLPALSKFDYVICDRYIMSTLAYQGFGRGEELETLKEINNYAAGDLKPDLTLLLDLKVETGLSRARKRAEDEKNKQVSSSWNRFEAEELEFHKKIKHGFLELAKNSNHLVELINAEENQETVLNKSLKAFEKHFSKKP